MSEYKPHGFCETPHENCTMNYCDENGCINRKRNLVEEPIETSNNKQSRLDLNMLASKLDEALSNETTESLSDWLKEKRMSNNEQSSVEWFAEMVSKMGYVSVEILEQAKARENENKIKSQIELIKSIGNQGPNAPLYGILKTTLIKLQQQIKSGQ